MPMPSSTSACAQPSRHLRTRVGRVQRDVQRQLAKLPEQVQAKGQDLLQRVGRILTQKTKDKNKLYALHAPEVECISKGKARNPYEFGVKVTVATTLKEGLVVGMLRSFGQSGTGQRFPARGNRVPSFIVGGTLAGAVSFQSVLR
jgi:hypothetical protein